MYSFAVFAPAARHVIFTLVLLVCGCDGSRYPAYGLPLEVNPDVRHGDMSWSADERLIIGESNHWVALHTGTREVPILWDLAPGADFLSVGWSIVKGKEGGGTSSIGPGGNHSCTFTDLGNPLAAISAHELGHLAGLSHTPDPHSFMFYAPSERNWTTDDESFCVESGICGSVGK